jgi:hypothetical protein
MRFSKFAGAVAIAMLVAVPLATAASIDEELAEELQAMVEKSEKVHKPLLTKPNDQAQIRKAVAQEQQNMIRMKDIIRKHGWPGKSLVGDDGAKAACLLVVQSNVDREFQKTCLRLMEQEAKKGEVEWKDVAFLTDLLLVLDGYEQRYGTQIKKIDKGKVTFHAIADVKNVDKRRKEVGLPPLAEFKKQLEEALKTTQNP